MGRRIAFSVALFALLAGAAYLSLNHDGALEAAGAVAGPVVEAGDGGLRLGPVARRTTRRGAIVGRVVDAVGKGVPGAAVMAQGPALSTSSGPLQLDARAEAGGAFRFGDLLAGEYVLFASSGQLASDAVGPIPLGAGEELRDLALVLEAGAALSGAVLDARDGKPIANASVSAGAASDKSDDKGRFRLAGLPGGTLVLSAFAEGYMPLTSEVELTRGRERTGADVHLERAGRVHGMVTAQGQPVAGAEVLAARYGFAARLSAIVSVGATGPDGTFTGSVPPGRMELVARAPGFAEARTEEFEIGPGGEHEANLQLGQGGTLLGTVRDAEGAGAPACRVEAFDSVHGRTTGQALTGPGGQYWIAGVPQAICLVVASCEAGRAEASGIKVAEGAQVQVDLQLGNGSIAGRVVDAAGKPVAGATLTVRPDGSAAPESPAGASRADGSFELRGLASNRYLVAATAPQGRAERAAVDVGTRDLVLSLGSGELVGTVLGDRSEPVTDFVVYAEPQQLGGGKPRSQRFLSTIGEFHLQLSPGRYGLRVGSPGFVSGTVPEVEVKAGATPSRVKVSLTRGAVVKGRTISVDGKPVAGVHVATHPNMLFAFGRAAPVPKGAFAVSDEAGQFTLTGVTPSERVQILAAKEGYAQREVVAVTPTADAPATVEIRLFPGGRGEEGEREFAGVGLTLGNQDGVVSVHESYEGGPGREAGLRSGDQILAVDGVPVSGNRIDDAVSRIRGEVGTTVTLTVRRDGRELQLAVPRAIVKF